MPDNENPYALDNPLYSVYEQGGPELREALLADVRRSKEGGYYADLREHLEEKTAQVKEILSNESPLPKEDEYLPAAWGGDMEIDFRVPSGGKCRVRRVDIVDLLGNGLLNKLDSLTNIVTSEHIPNAAKSGKISPAVAAGVTKDLLGDQQKSDEFRKVIDNVLLRVVVRPQLWPVPGPGEPRVKGCVYVDSIPFTDRTAIFNWALTGKHQEEMAQFREEAGEPVGDMESGEGVRSTPVEPA